MSLAIWMGGCAVELDAARRAHLGPERGRGIYHALCTALARELVIDVMSGASAGGINGALLAAAIRHQRRIGAKWMRSAGSTWARTFARLLHLTSNPAPTSLMQGELFATELEQTFVDLLGGADTELPPEHAGLAALDAMLDVATTDLSGERVAFRDTWGSDLIARQHQAMFRFREDAHYAAPTLAHAARASASFPIAFEPFWISSPAATLAGFTSPRWVVDGGLLDNAPIAAALALIPTRPATRQVRRWLCYLNADPPTDVVEAAAPATPKLAKIAGAVVALPRSAPFVGQLAAIEQATRRGALGADLPALPAAGARRDRAASDRADPAGALPSAAGAGVAGRAAGRPGADGGVPRELPSRTPTSPGCRTRSTRGGRTGAGSGGSAAPSGCCSCCSTCCARRWRRPSRRTGCGCFRRASRSTSGCSRSTRCAAGSAAA